MMTDEVVVSDEWTSEELIRAVVNALPDPQPSQFQILNRGCAAFHWQGENYRVTSQKLSTLCSVHCERLLAEGGRPEPGSALIALALHAWLVGPRLLKAEEVSRQYDKPAGHEDKSLSQFMRALERAFELIEDDGKVDGGREPAPGPGEELLDPPVPLNVSSPQVHLTVDADRPTFVVILPKGCREDLEFVRDHLQGQVHIHRIVQGD